MMSISYKDIVINKRATVHNIRIQNTIKDIKKQLEEIGITSTFLNDVRTIYDLLEVLRKQREKISESIFEVLKLGNTELDNDTVGEFKNIFQGDSKKDYFDLLFCLLGKDYNKRKDKVQKHISLTLEEYGKLYQEQKLPEKIKKFMQEQGQLKLLLSLLKEFEIPLNKYEKIINCMTMLQNNKNFWELLGNNDTKSHILRFINGYENLSSLYEFINNIDKKTSVSIMKNIELENFKYIISTEEDPSKYYSKLSGLIDDTDDFILNSFIEKLGKNFQPLINSINIDNETYGIDILDFPLKRQQETLIESINSGDIKNYVGFINALGNGYKDEKGVYFQKILSKIKEKDISLENFNKIINETDKEKLENAFKNMGLNDDFIEVVAEYDKYKNISTFIEHINTNKRFPTLGIGKNDTSSHI